MEFRLTLIKGFFSTNIVTGLFLLAIYLKYHSTVPTNLIKLLIFVWFMNTLRLEKQI